MKRLTITTLVAIMIISTVWGQETDLEGTVTIRALSSPGLLYYNTLSDLQEGRVFIQNRDLHVEAEFDDLVLIGEDDMRLRADSIVFGPDNTTRTEFTFHHNSGNSTEHGLTIENDETNQHRWTLYTNNSVGILNVSRGGVQVGFFATDGIYTGSDKKLKKNIQSLDPVMPGIMALRPSRYNYIKSEIPEKKSIGFIAQEVQNHFPELVFDSPMDDGAVILQLNYAGFGVLAIKAIQEQQLKIEELEKQVREIDDLKTQVSQLSTIIRSYMEENEEGK